MRGAFALVYLFDGEDDLLIGARQGAPLAVGYGDGEMYLGSDALALAPFTDRVAYLEEGDWVVATRAGGDVPRRRRTASSSGKTIHSAAGGLLAEKGNYRHFMAKEIHEQPEVVGHTLAHYVDMAAQRLKPFAWPVDPGDALARHDHRLRHRLYGRAWSANTGSSASPACRSRSTSPPNTATAKRRSTRTALTIVISQSGETADTLASLRYAKANGAEDDRRRQRADFEHRAALPTPPRRRSPARRSASPRPRPSPASSPPWPAWRSGWRARAARSTEAEEAALVGELVAAPGCIAQALKLEPLLEADRPQARPRPRRALSRPRHRPIRWRSRARSSSRN